jgi:hypothetical protein
MRVEAVIGIGLSCAAEMLPNRRTAEISISEIF